MILVLISSRLDLIRIHVLNVEDDSTWLILWIDSTSTWVNILLILHIPYDLIQGIYFDSISRVSRIFSYTVSILLNSDIFSLTFGRIKRGSDWLSENSIVRCTVVSNGTQHIQTTVLLRNKLMEAIRYTTVIGTDRLKHTLCIAASYL